MKTGMKTNVVLMAKQAGTGRTRVAPWLALNLLAIAAGTVCAQTAPAPAEVAAATKDGKPLVTTTLETVTVSATRRRELIREVPLAISSVDAERLQETGAKSLNDYLATQPGVVLQNSGTTDNSGNIVIRGLTTGVDTNSPTTVYVDDTPLGIGTPFDINLMDLRRLEVLRGPQGTLYGSSAMGGIVKYISNEPDTSEFSGKLGVGVSQTAHGGMNSVFNGVVNVPLKQDVAALRVSAFGSRDAGYVDASGPAAKTGVNRHDSQGARVSLLLTPTRNLGIKLSAMTQTRNSDGADRVVYDAVTGKPAGDLLYTKLGVAEPRKGERKLYSASLDYDLQWARFSSITSHQTAKDSSVTDFQALAEAFGLEAAHANVLAENTRTTQEFRLVSQSTGDVQWLVGAFFDKLKLQVHEVDLAYSGGASFPFSGSDSGRDYKESALYGNVTWNLTRELALTGGVRLANYKQTDVIAPLGAPTRTIGFDESPKTYLLTANYRLTPKSNVYLRAASGYRPGGANYSAIDPATNQPYPGARPSYGTDSAWTYEAGYKASLPAGSVELTVFDTEWKDLQQFTQPGGINTAGFTSNLGKARIRGIEAAVTFKPVRDLSLGASLSLLDPKLLTDSPGLGGFAGDRLPNSPKVALALTSRYEFDLSGLPSFAGLNVSYQGDRNSSFPKGTQVPNFVLPAFTQVDLSGGIKFKGYELALYVRNLADKRGLLGASTSENTSTGRTYVHVIAPRTIGVNLAASF